LAVLTAPHVRAAQSTSVRVATTGVLLGVLLLIAWHVVRKVTQLRLDSLTALYTIVICGYVLSRFLLAALYRPPRDAGIEPRCAVIVPAYNEGAAVARTIHALMALDYPPDKLEVVVVDDGSSDDTWQHMTAAAAAYPDVRLGPRHDPTGAPCPPAERAGGYREAVQGRPAEPAGDCPYCQWRYRGAGRSRVRCIRLGANRGKRAAMAAGIRATSAPILVFVDSDSLPARDGVRRLVQGFADPTVGAISGLTYVRNAEVNLLTRMQAARYYVSFQLLKAAESALGAVACCSGCFAAYRREAVAAVLPAWEHQRFLGVECTYGDDRALTNMVLRRGWRAVYDRRATAWTEVPERYRTFFRQQLRWKKSWAREGPILLSHVWRTRPLAFPSVLVNTVAGLLSPLIVAWNLLHPLLHRGALPLVYALGLYLVSMAYGLLYRALRRDGLWAYAFFGTFFYVAFSAQLLWAILRIRDGKWGTRGA
jgi:hyaluronan synthase